MNELIKRRNLTVLFTVLLTVTTLGFFSTMNQSNTSALSISQTEGKVIAVDFDGIDGESTYIETEDWVDAISYSWAIHKPGGGATGQSRRRGTAVVDPFVVVKNVDKSSPKLMDKILKGEIIPRVFVVEYVDGSLIWEYELKNVQITSFFVAGSRDFDGPDLEQVSLNFEEIVYTYNEYDDTGRLQGSVEATWKVEEGTS